MAEAEGAGQLAERGAVQVQAADGAVEVGPGYLGVTLGVDQALLGAPRRVEPLLVHVSTVTRH